MADNVAITAGTGTSIAADDIASVFYQRVKLSLGADGAAVDAVAGAGAVGTGVQRVTLASDDPGVALLTTMDADTSLLAGTVANSAQAVSTLLKITSVDLSTDTAAHADGDVLADSQIVTACLRANDGTGTITNITAIDDADQGFGIDLFFLDANVSIGTENAAPSISDANAANILGWLRIAAADWIDLGGVRIASVPCSIPVKGVTSNDDIYVAAVARGAGTWAGGTDITLRIAIACD